MVETVKVHFKDGSTCELAAIDARAALKHADDWRLEPFSKSEIEEAKKQIAKEAAAKEKAEKGDKSGKDAVIDQDALSKAVESALAKRDAEHQASIEKIVADALEKANAGVATDTKGNTPGIGNTPPATKS